MIKRPGHQLFQVLPWGALLFGLFCHLGAANRGLEMTDEASYLLIALDPWNTWGHGTFHGFLLRPLYLLGGESVAGIRWIGYAILLGAAWRLAGAVRLRLAAGKAAVADFCAPVLMVASMTAYCGGIRTPCYNWMILLGAILAWSGWLRAGSSRLGAVELGAGLTIALIGKWGAALVLLALFVALSLIHRGEPLGPSRKGWQTALLTFALITGSFAFYAGSKGILDTLQAGVLIAQTTGSHGWFIVPKYGWEIVYYAYRVARAYFWLVPAILVFWWLARRNPRKWTPEKIAGVLFAAGLSLAAARGWWRGGIEQFGKESVLAGCWLLGVAWTVWAVKRRAEERGQGTEGGNPWPVAGGRRTVGGGQKPVLWGLVATPFLCGIGTNTSIADYAGQGTVFFAATGILLFGQLPSPRIAWVAGIAMVGLCLIQSSRVSSALSGMYRLGSVFDQTELLTIGPEAGRLHVDAGTLVQVNAIHKVLESNQIPARMPVVGVDSLCGWVYLVGARSPGVPWFFRDQAEYLKQVLMEINPRTLKTSWVWLRSSSQIQDPARWWPSDRVPPPSRKAGEIPLHTDRGHEILFMFSPDR
jgi:hypothetical protein